MTNWIASKTTKMSSNTQKLSILELDHNSCVMLETLNIKKSGENTSSFVIYLPICQSQLSRYAHIYFLIRKVLSFSEACFDLISSSSLYLKIQIMGRKITENPPQKVNIFSFLFILKFLTRNWVFFNLITFEPQIFSNFPAMI